MNLPLWNLHDAYILPRPDPPRLRLMGGILGGVICAPSKQSPRDFAGAFQSSLGCQFKQG